MYPNLKLQLWRMGMRQNQLAKSLNMDETILSKIVNGFRQPSPTVKGQIAAVLHMDEKWLFEAPEAAARTNADPSEPVTE
jgi:transcriptional regulator with XRE-family HTH domain